MKYIGIDLGTSSLKALLMNENGVIEKSVTKEYSLSFPQPGWSEQNPSDWWKATIETLAELGNEEVEAIGVAGQMHGLVVLDEKDEVIRPCILWNDGRTQKQTDYLNKAIGQEKLSEYTANIAFAGFTAPKLLWMKENEPENFSRIKKIMLPKDYLVYRLTGAHTCDYSDASGMLLLDVKNKCYSRQMCDICSVKEEQLPKLHESNDVVGTINCAQLPQFKGVKVVAGAGDNAAAAIGTNTIKDGACNISLGTSGTIFITSDTFKVDSQNVLHAFAHASGRYHLMGCILSAASCNKWFCEDILNEKDFAMLQKDITEADLGNNHVYYLPYLMGERSPLNDTDARSCFIGMDLSTSRKQMVLSILEGVGFALRDCLEVAKAQGIKISQSNLCGGGAKSPLWQQIIANILNVDICLLENEEGPGYGAALLAMAGNASNEQLQKIAQERVKIRKVIHPQSEIAARYETRYQTFKKMYPALKDIFKEL